MSDFMKTIEWLDAIGLEYIVEGGRGIGIIKIARCDSQTLYFHYGRLSDYSVGGLKVKFERPDEFDSGFELANTRIHTNVKCPGCDHYVIVDVDDMEAECQECNTTATMKWNWKKPNRDVVVEDMEGENDE